MNGERVAIRTVRTQQARSEEAQAEKAQDAQAQQARAQQAPAQQAQAQQVPADEARQQQQRGDRELHPRSFIRPFAIAGAVILLLGSVLQLITGIVPASSSAGFAVRAIANVFWADRDINVWAWYSVLGDGLLAGAFALIVVLRRAARLPVAADVVFTVVATYLSLDEGASIHERFGSLGARLGGHWTYGWVILGLPVAIVAGLLLLWVARRTDRVTRRRLVLAGAVFLLGAVVLESLGGVIHESWKLSWTSLPYVLETTVEEGLEVAGVLIALRAALSRLRATIGPGGLRMALRDGASDSGTTSARPRQRRRT